MVYQCFMTTVICPLKISSCSTMLLLQWGSKGSTKGAGSLPCGLRNFYCRFMLRRALIHSFQTVSYSNRSYPLGQGMEVKGCVYM